MKRYPIFALELKQAHEPSYTKIFVTQGKWRLTNTCDLWNNRTSTWNELYQNFCHSRKM